jgi:hypothetical protein
VKHTWLWAGGLALAVGLSTTFARPAPVSAEDAAKPAFIGPDECKKCHLKHHKTWKPTAMAKSFEVLKPDQAADKKKAGGLDPAKDYTTDAKCLKCHTTGYGTESGYPAPAGEGKTWSDAEKARATKLQGVTCEACHGPGSLYAPYKKDHEQFKLADVQKLGATTPPTAQQCLACHVKECPTMPADYAFDFEKAKKSNKDFHDHVPLKFPH